MLGNWEKQIKDHVVSGNLSVYTYHGATKGITAAKLAKYDVVLTTYQTVATDITGKVDRSKQYYDSDDDNKSSQKGKKKQKTASKILSTVQWRRIVADEGHVLKNPKSHSTFLPGASLTTVTQAYAGLKAARRWICTGEFPAKPANIRHTNCQLPRGSRLAPHLHPSLQAPRPSECIPYAADVGELFQIHPPPPAQSRRSHGRQHPPSHCRPEPASPKQGQSKRSGRKAGRVASD